MTSSVQYQFDANRLDIPNYTTSHFIPLPQAMRSVTGLPLANMNLGNPIRIKSHDENIALAGSIDPLGIHGQTFNSNVQPNSTLAQNCIIAFDVSSPTNSLRAILPIESPVIKLANICNRTFLSAFQDGTVAVYDYNSSNSDETAIQGIHEAPFYNPARAKWHNDIVADFNVSPLDPTKVISVSADQELVILDVTNSLEREYNTLQSAFFEKRFALSCRFNPLNSLTAVVGTTSFNNMSTNNNQCFVEIYDLRSKLNTSTPALYHQCNTSTLTTVCPIDDNLILSGYGNGTFQLLDQRKMNAPLITIDDPFVKFIDDIQYNPTSNAFIVSGLNDFTVWKIKNHNSNPMTQNMKNTQYDNFYAGVWSHSHPSSNVKDENIAYFATFWDDDSVLATDLRGQAHYYSLMFQRQYDISSTSDEEAYKNERNLNYFL